MARSIAGLCVCVGIFVLLFVVVAEGAPKLPKQKHVKCHDKKHFPLCNQRNDLICPLDCPRNCTVDCVSCLAVCTPPPPPPPPPPPRQRRRYSPPPPSSLLISPPPPTEVLTLPPPPPPSSVPTSPPPNLTPPPPPPTNVPTVLLPPPPPPPPPPRTPVSTPPHQPSPPPPSTSPKKARCKNRNFEKCYYTEHTCPAACPDKCEVDCVTCSPVCDCNRPGAICQDPRFIGADGITFYFHGKKDRDFCVVSDSNLHINAHFIGRRNNNMKRDFTWVQSLGILFDSHRLFVGAKKTSTWDDAVDRLALAFDGEPVFLPAGEGAKWQPRTAPSVSIARSRGSNAVVIEVEENFKIKATVVPITEKDSRIHNYGINEEEDCFAHLDLGFKFYSLTGDVDGVLGQTYGGNYSSKVKMGVLMPVLGGDKEFESSGLFSHDCAAARFSGRSHSAENFEYGNLNCASGVDGQGVVCKR